MQEIPWYLVYAYLTCDEVEKVLEAFPIPSGVSASEVDHRCRVTTVSVAATAGSIDFLELLTAYPAVKVLNVSEFHSKDLLIKIS